MEHLEYNEAGRIYIITENDRINITEPEWLKKRIFPNDIILTRKITYVPYNGSRTEKYSCMLIEIADNFVKGILESKFSVIHGFSSPPLKWLPSERVFHLLCAGESARVDEFYPKHPLTEIRERNTKLSGERT